MGVLVEGRTPTEWAAIVRADLAQAVVGFIAAGQHLAEAKATIPHGEWEQWVRDEVRISPGTARMLMLIAEHPALSNRQHINDLPPSWGTLYELSRLEAPLLEAAIQAHEVHPELERKEARALVVEYKQRAAAKREDAEGWLAKALGPPLWTVEEAHKAPTGAAAHGKSPQRGGDGKGKEGPTAQEAVALFKVPRGKLDREGASAGTTGGTAAPTTPQ
jgi:hypothetical protein